MAQLPGSDIATILELHDRWIKEERAGNNAQIISFCTDDIRWIPPNLPPLEGKQAIAQFLENNRVDLKDIQTTDVVTGGSDAVAYLISNFSSRYLTHHSAEIHESTGTHVWFLRKTVEGWKVAVVTWSSW